MKLIARLVALAALLLVSPTQAQFIQNLNAPNVSCTTAASLIVPQRLRSAVTIGNPSSSTATVYIGSTSSLTSATGFDLVPGATITLQPFNGPVYCISASGSQSVNVVETY
jgi:hypothetical protein